MYGDKLGLKLVMWFVNLYQLSKDFKTLLLLLLFFSWELCRLQTDRRTLSLRQLPIFAFVKTISRKNNYYSQYTHRRERSLIQECIVHEDTSTSIDIFWPSPPSPPPPLSLPAVALRTFFLSLWRFVFIKHALRIIIFSYITIRILIIITISRINNNHHHPHHHHYCNGSRHYNHHFSFHNGRLHSGHAKKNTFISINESMKIVSHYYSII